MTVVLHAMSAPQERAWQTLLELHARHPTDWTLVGGQMVHLHCAERGASPVRPTDDADTVLDVRAEPHALLKVTTTLKGLGFGPVGTSPQGHQHRWVREDGAMIDVLIPRHVGETAANRKGAGGGTTLETPGAQQALDRSEDVEVDVAGLVGTVRRPSLLGALVAKAAARTVSLDRARDRHLTDFAVLATLVRPADQVHTATKRDRWYLDGMLAAIGSHPRAWAGVPGAEQGLERLRLALRAPVRPQAAARSGIPTSWDPSSSGEMSGESTNRARDESGTAP